MIDEVIEGELDLVLLEPSILELAHVLAGKLDFDSGRLGEVITFLHQVASGFESSPDGPVDAVTGDRDDDLVLACAVSSGVEILVSGDRRHLLPVGERGGVRILTPQALLAELRAA